MDEKITLAVKELEQAKAWFLVVEKGFQLKEQQLRNAQTAYAKASSKLAKLRNEKTVFSYRNEKNQEENTKA